MIRLTHVLLPLCIIVLVIARASQAADTLPDADYEKKVASLRREFSQKLKSLEKEFFRDAKKLKEEALAELIDEREKHRRSSEPGSFALAQKAEEKREALERLAVPRLRTRLPSHRELSLLNSKLMGQLNKLLGIDQQLLVNPGCEILTENNAIASWTKSSGNWVARKEPSRNHNGEHHFYAGDCKYGVLSQQVDVSAAAELIDNREIEFAASANLFCLEQKPADSGEIIVEFLDSEQNIIGTFTTGKLVHKGSWKRAGLTHAVAPKTRSLLFKLVAHRTGPKNSKKNNAEYDDASLMLRRKGA